MGVGFIYWYFCNASVACSVAVLPRAGSPTITKPQLLFGCQKSTLLPPSFFLFSLNTLYNADVILKLESFFLSYHFPIGCVRAILGELVNLFESL